MKAISDIQNELVEKVICSIMELIDGYGDMDSQLDLIDRKTNKSLRGDTQLHDKFMDYLSESEGIKK